MKRIAAGIAAVLLLVSGLNNPKPVIVSDSITVSPDGTFHYEKMVEKPVTGPALPE